MRKALEGGGAGGKREPGGSLECGLSEKDSKVLKEQILALESRAIPLKHEAKQKTKNRIPKRKLV